MISGTRTAVVSLALLAALLAALTGCGSESGSTGDTAGDPAGQVSDSTSPSAGDSTGPAASPSDSTSPSATSSLPATDDPTETIPLPTCDSVWVEGQPFPRSYEGCLDGDQTIQADSSYCEFGKPLFSYGKHYYAVANGPVNRTEQVLAKDKAFRTAQRACGG